MRINNRARVLEHQHALKSQFGVCSEPCAFNWIPSQRLSQQLQEAALLRPNEDLPCTRQPVSKTPYLGLRDRRCKSESEVRRCVWGGGGGGGGSSSRPQERPCLFLDWRCQKSPTMSIQKQSRGAHARRKWRHDWQPAPRRRTPPDTPIVSANRKRAALCLVTDAP